MEKKNNWMPTHNEEILVSHTEDGGYKKRIFKYMRNNYYYCENQHGEGGCFKYAKQNIVSTKMYTITVTEDQDGLKNMHRTNNGFDAFELLGLAQFISIEIKDQITGKYKPDTVKREVIQKGVKQAVKDRVGTLDEDFSATYHRPSIDLAKENYSDGEKQTYNLIKSIERESNLRGVKDAAQKLIDLLNLCKI